MNFDLNVNSRSNLEVTTLPDVLTSAKVIDTMSKPALSGNQWQTFKQNRVSCTIVIINEINNNLSPGVLLERPHHPTKDR